MNSLRLHRQARTLRITAAGLRWLYMDHAGSCRACLTSTSGWHCREALKLRADLENAENFEAVQGAP